MKTEGTIIEATTPASATYIAYEAPRRTWESSSVIALAKRWIANHEARGLTHYAFTYNGGDVLHVFLGDTPFAQDDQPTTYAFVANTTLGHLTTVWELSEDGHPENFRVPEGWRRMDGDRIAITLGEHHGHTGQDVG